MKYTLIITWQDKQVTEHHGFTDEELKARLHEILVIHISVIERFTVVKENDN